MSSQMILRLDPELKEKVNNLARAENKNVSELVRELLEDYVKNRDINSYIDDLWNKIGSKIEKKGFGSKDIQTAISSARARNDQNCS